MNWHPITEEPPIDEPCLLAFHDKDFDDDERFVLVSGIYVFDGAQWVDEMIGMPCGLGEYWLSERELLQTLEVQYG